ncbi:hypothetical protein [Candidatus Aquicultor secundus]|nr:hypothetical protein [Candidatus Aquicultor secundus]
MLSLPLKLKSCSAAKITLSYISIAGKEVPIDEAEILRAIEEAVR